MATIDLEKTYKSALGESHEAGLQAVFDAGHAAGQKAALAVHETNLPAVKAAAYDEGHAAAVAEFEAGLKKSKSTEVPLGERFDDGQKINN